MFDLANPHIDWVDIATGMGIEATRVTGAMSLAVGVKSAFADRGPRARPGRYRRVRLHSPRLAPRA